MLEGVEKKKQERDGAFLEENWGKLLTLLSGVGLSMVAVNNNNPGLMLLGSTVSRLAGSEIGKWNQRWDTIMESELKKEENKSTVEERRIKEGILMKEWVNNNGGPPSTRPDAVQALEEIGLDVTMENIARISGMAVGRDVAEDLKKKDAEVAAEGIAISGVADEAASVFSQKGSYSSIASKEPGERQVYLSNWIDKYGLDEEGQIKPAYAIAKQNIEKFDSAVFKGEKTDTRTIAPSWDGTGLPPDEVTKIPTPSTKFFMRHSSAADLNETVELTEESINENQIFSLLDPGTHRMGDVIANVQDYITRNATLKTEPNGQKYIYLYIRPRSYSITETTTGGGFAPPVQRRKAEAVKVYSGGVNQENWEEVLSEAILDGRLDKELGKHFEMALLKAKGKPK
jgi:hypothetical protein